MNRFVNFVCISAASLVVALDVFGVVSSARADMCTNTKVSCAVACGWWRGYEQVQLAWKGLAICSESRVIDALPTAGNCAQRFNWSNIARDCNQYVGDVDGPRVTTVCTSPI